MYKILEMIKNKSDDKIVYPKETNIIEIIKRVEKIFSHNIRKSKTDPFMEVLNIIHENGVNDITLEEMESVYRKVTKFTPSPNPLEHYMFGVISVMIILLMTETEPKEESIKSAVEYIEKHGYEVRLWIKE